MKRSRPRTSSPKPKRSISSSRVAEANERARLARFARSLFPKDFGRRGKRLLGDAFVLREYIYGVGAAAARVLGLWSEISIKVISLALADVTDREASRRGMAIWRVVERLSAKKLASLRRQIERDLEEDRQRKDITLNARQRRSSKRGSQRRRH